MKTVYSIPNALLAEVECQLKLPLDAQLHFASSMQERLREKSEKRTDQEIRAQLSCSQWTWLCSCIIPSSSAPPLLLNLFSVAMMLVQILVIWGVHVVYMCVYTYIHIYIYIYYIDACMHACMDVRTYVRM